MKYPQLVSTRAVNAISDWLVSRLEQLGVEAPQIYSRLLLSLLQSSVQINDPIEFSNLETFFANRKGSNRRYPPCDTNTLKKINAVQCLREIVSSEQEIAAIEALVDELFEKLIDIEKQSTDVEDDDQPLVATLSVVTTSSFTPQPNQSKYSHHFIKHHKGLAAVEGGILSISGGNRNKTANDTFTKAASKSLDIDRRFKDSIADTETDPKKRYFRAFPALTKEMEDSFRILRRNSKSLTWPVNRKQIASSSISSTDSSLDLVVEKKCIKSGENRNTGGGGTAIGRQVASIHGGVNSNGANGVKRKTKRRRNQALSKGKTIQNFRKNSCGGGGVVGGISNNRYRSSSPFWDTDFEGCWEMGRDLIKEFIIKQNKRNRSTSESAAYGHLNQQKQLEHQEMLKEKKTDQIISTEKLSQVSSSLLNLPPVDISFCCNTFLPPFNDEDDTLASVSEMANASSNSTQRLYKRDVSVSGGSHDCLPQEIAEDNQLDFAQFKAKFDSSLEALWKTTGDETSEQNKDSGAGIYSMSSSIMQLSLLPTVAPFKENLQNFWTNYYNHHFDLAKIPQESEGAFFSKADKGHSSLSCSGGFGNDITNTSDYCSMPGNLDELDKSVHNYHKGDCERDTPINVFLQNSIWSKNSNVGTGDTDESFYKKVWNSTQKNNQLDSMDTAGGTSHDTAFQLPQYSKSKWSEGINVGPNANIALQQQQQHLLVQVSGASTASSTMSTSGGSTEQVKHLSDLGVMLNVGHNRGGNASHNGVDCIDSATTSVSSTTSCSSYSHSATTYNWQTPLLGQSLQPDMQSWSTSNPISLTEMYGSGPTTTVVDGGKRALNKFLTAPAIEPEEVNTFVSIVTLPNHNTATSAFVEYSRIKSAVNICKQQPTELQQQHNLLPQSSSQDNYDADEENLLTSERTHFHPIKTYADGHSFEICSALDVVEYERSQSGYLYMETDKYLEYTRNDVFLTEEESTAAAANAFVGVPLYATSNCEAAYAIGGGKVERKNVDFVIKFRIRNCEVACQTVADLPPKMPDAVPAPVEQHPLCLIFSSSMQGMKLQTTGLACNDAIEALNKAVAAAAKAASSTRNSLLDDSHWLPTITNAYCSTTTWPMEPKTGVADAVDFQMSTSEASEDCCSLSNSAAVLEQWSMHEIGKKCELQGHDTSTVKMPHTLWGMCAACNDEFKSIPANRLLKDELQLEADEIMSDLKYMQDLYIGESAAAAGDSDSDWGDIGTDTEEEEEVENIINTPDVCLHENLDEGANRYGHVDANVDHLMHDDQNPAQGNRTTQDVFYKVNRLIADLLCRENTKTLVNALALPASDAQFIGNLWGDCNEAENIWQPKETATTTVLTPIDLFRRINDGKQQKVAALRMEDETFLSHLSWEHDNLAEIWEKKTPPPPSMSVVTAVSADINQNVNTIATVNQNVSSRDDDDYDNDNNSIIARRNFKNLFDVTAATTSSINEQLKPQVFKRVQQLLNANLSAVACKHKISNRKRRHSASQNFFHTSPHATASNSNNVNIHNNNNSNNNSNNNNVKIADLNQFNLKLNAIGNKCQDQMEMQKIIKSLTTQANSVDDDSNFVYEYDLYANADEANVKQPKQTIITCKYWTTIDPILSPSGEDIVEGATFSCLLDKNASILKHVTMVTRPLTR